MEGLADSLAALADGKVADLFVADRPSSTATAWIGPGNGGLAVSENALRERGVPRPVADRADAAMVRSLALTDGDLFFLPEDVVRAGEPGEIKFPRDGVCATCAGPTRPDPRRQALETAPRPDRPPGRGGRFPRPA